MTSIKEIRETLNYDDKNMLLHKVFSGISVYFTKVLLELPITANQVTLLSIFSGIIGLFLITSQNYINYLLGFLLLYLYWTLDFSDGVIARCKYSMSLKGKYLDYIGHLVVHPFIFLAIGIHLFNESGNLLHLIVGTAVAFLYLIYFTNHKLYLILNKKNKSKIKKYKQGIVFKIQKSIRYLLNIVSYFIIASIITYFLSMCGVRLNLTFYLLCFYFLLYLLLFIGQTITYFKDIPATKIKVRPK